MMPWWVAGLAAWLACLIGWCFGIYYCQMKWVSEIADLYSTHQHNPHYAKALIDLVEKMDDPNLLET